MENKKTGIVIALMAIILFVVVAFIFMYEPVKKIFVQPSVEQQKEVTFEFTCDYLDDQDAYENAIELNELNACDCIGDINSANACRSVVLDSLAYDNAVSHMDVDLCEKIKAIESKSSCVTLVGDSIEYLEEEDPQYLAQLYAQSHSAKSVEYLKEAIEEESDRVENYVSLALVYAELGLAEQEGGNSQVSFVEKAFDIVEQAKKIEPNNSEVYRAQAYAYEILPDAMMAIDSYDRAIELDEKNILAYVGRGHAYNMAGMLTAAHKDYQKADSIDVDNKYMAVYSNLCRLESSRDDLIESAIKNCLIVVNEVNHDPSIQSNAHQILGKLYVQKNDLDQAYNALIRAQSLTPDDPNAFVSMAQLYNKKQEFDKAKENATAAIALSPAKAVAYQELGSALYGAKQQERAIVIISKGLTLIDDDVTLLNTNKDALRRKMHYTLADIYDDIGNIEQGSANRKMGDDIFNGIK